jgi:hypothetical protein
MRLQPGLPRGPDARIGGELRSQKNAVTDAASARFEEAIFAAGGQVAAGWRGSPLNTLDVDGNPVNAL